MSSTTYKVGVVGIPGKWSTEVLADELEAKTGFRRVISLDDIALDLTTGKVSHKGFDLSELDGIAVKKISQEYSHHTMDRLELLRWLEDSAVRIFSPVASMDKLINRLSCTIALRQADIPMPATCVTESVDEAIAKINEYGEAVFKPLFSTKARGMGIISKDQSQDNLHAAVEAFHTENPMMYLQQKRELPGQDLGMVFVGGEYRCTYARVSQSDAWNTTINSGGKYQAYTPTAELIELAQQAQAPFKMDFTTVDVAETDTGPIVFEVSAFGGFRGALEGAEFNAAAAYADHILKQLGR